MWSHRDPVTVFGAALSPIGWAEVAPMFEKIAADFSDCRSWEWEVLAADVGEDFAHLLAIERTTGRWADPDRCRTCSVDQRRGGRAVVSRHTTGPAWR